MDSSSIFLGIKVKPGPIERFKLENYSLENTVDHLKNEAGKKVNISSSSLVLIFHGKILKADTTLQDSGVKHGEMVHVVKRKIEDQPPPRTTYHDAELQSLNVALRSLGCTPNAPGWTRAMQLLAEESVMNEIMSVAPSVGTECVASSILHEVELLAALGANIGSMRRGAEALPELPAALLRLLRIHRDRAHAAPLQDNGPAVSGFAYSLEALSEEEDAEDEEAEEPERSPITQEQLAAALMAASEAVSSTSRAPGGAGGAGGAVSRQTFLQLLRGAAGETSRTSIGTVFDTTAGPERPVRTGAAYNRTLLEIMNSPGPGEAATDQNTGASSGRGMVTPEAFNEAISEAITRAAPAGVAMDQSAGAGSGRAVITPEAFNEAISEAITRAAPAGVAMDQSAGASSSQSPARVVRDNYATQLNHMHEMGLLDDALNIRALHICAGDVNAAINLVFSGAIADD